MIREEAVHVNKALFKLMAVAPGRSVKLLFSSHVVYDVLWEFLSSGEEYRAKDIAILINKTNKKGEPLATVYGSIRLLESLGYIESCGKDICDKFRKSIYWRAIL